MINSQPATDDQLLRVMLACDAFREHWGKFRAMPFDPKFDGGLDDIGALDYLHYEGLDFPPGDEEAAILVWGNVLVRQVGFTWVSSLRGDMLLHWGDQEFDIIGVAVWPLGRFREMEVGGCPQFDRFAWLTGRLVASCLALHHDEEFDARLRRLGEAVGMP